MSIELVMPSNHLILCCPFVLLSYIFPSIRVFSKESALHIRWPKYWSFSFSIVLPMNIQDWSPLGWTGWICLQSKGLSGVFSNTTVQKHQFFGSQPCLCSNSPTYTWLLEKTIALIRWTFVGKVMSLLFNTLSRFVIAFLPRKKTLLISWLQSPFTVRCDHKKLVKERQICCIWRWKRQATSQQWRPPPGAWKKEMDSPLMPLDGFHCHLHLGFDPRRTVRLLTSRTLR